MTYDAIDFLASICRPDTTLFEWGSGGSTLFFAKRCRHVITVEHDREWSTFVAEKLKKLGVTNVDFKEVAGEEIPDWAQRDYRNPDHFVSGDRNSVGLSYERYVKAIDQYPGDYFDIAVVDGRVRNGCIKRAIPRVKQGGWLVVDNSDRRYYLENFPALRNPVLWEKVEFQGPVFFQHAFGKTSFFRKL